MLRNITTLALLGAFAAPPLASAQVFDVPGNFPTIQAALNEAKDNDLITVHGGWYGPIRITRPVRIVGVPRFTINVDLLADPNDPTKAVDAITLDGPGAAPGQPPLVISNFETVGTSYGGWYSTASYGVRGGGFRQVRFTEGIIQAAPWVQLTGIGAGADAVKLQGVESVILERCELRGGFSDTDASDYYTAPDGGAGLRADGARVVLIDSTVRGGNGPHMSFSEDYCPGGPLDFCDGGPGLVAGKLYVSGSTVQGGQGQPVYCGTEVAWQEANGPDLLCPDVNALPHTLSASGPPNIGHPLTLSWTGQGPGVLLFSPMLGSQPAFLGPQKGLLFLVPPIEILDVSGLPQLRFDVPYDGELFGLSFGLQRFDASGLGNPMLMVIQDSE